MLFLSNAAIRYAVNICEENDRYKVGIAVNRNNREATTEMLLDISEELPGVKQIINSHYCFEILFKNESTIKVIPATTSARANKCHLLIVDPEVSLNVILNDLEPCETLMWSEYWEKQGTKARSSDE